LFITAPFSSFRFFASTRTLLRKAPQSLNRHLSSDLKRPVKVVKPAYPPAALKAGVGGVVNLTVVVGKDGRVENAKVMSGPTLLRQAALDAVKQWEWEPVLLNSSPIRVRTRVTLRFDLHNKTTGQE
jgi:TonB family protein